MSQSNKGDTNDVELYEKVEKLFELKMSNQGVFIGIKYHGEKRYHWTTYDAFLKLRKSIENLIAQETNKARLEELELYKWHRPNNGMPDFDYIHERFKALTADKEQTE